MTNNNLHQLIEGIQNRILEQGKMVEKNLQDALQAYSNNDKEAAQKVIEKDKEVDLSEINIEKKCLKAIALFQPVAIDLRMIIAFLKMNNDLERIGDLTVNIAQRAEMISASNLNLIRFKFDQCYEKVQIMLNDTLKAFIEKDLELAKNVIKRDVEINECKKNAQIFVYNRLLSITNESQVGQLLSIYAVSKTLERIGDLCKNLCEDIIYLVNGQIIRHGILFELKDI